MLKIMKASAGSGKTYSLTRTYISLLLRSKDRYAYRHILAVTFTNKATDEMKSRILKELHVMATDTAKSDYLKDFVPSVFPSQQELQEKSKAVLQDILHDYSAFAVSTIDKFFQQTLKAFSREIGQFASYQVELDKDSLVAESVDRILDSLTEDSGSLLAWLTDNVLEQIAQGGRYSMDANLLDMALRLKSSQRQELVEKEKIDEDKVYTIRNLQNIRKTCRQIMADFRKEVKDKAARALGILTSADVNPADSNRGFLKALYVYADLKDGEAIVAPKDTFFEKAKESKLWFAKSKAAKLLPLVYPFLEAPLEDFCALWDKDFAVYNTARILDEQIYGLGVAGELRRTFAELMRETNVLCIEDSNTILRDIIDGSDAPFVYGKLGVRFDHFLLDEFQDTSMVQWDNFRPLLKNSVSQGFSNLVVGDVKQSIYRWRQSDWSLLDHQVQDAFEGMVDKDVLETNFRSCKGIVDFNNEYFKAAAAYLDERFGQDCNVVRSIYSDVEQKSAKGGDGMLEVMFCDKDMHYQNILDAVNRAVESGYRPGDITVLVRLNQEGAEIASYLIENGISVLSDDSLKVASSLTVRRLVAFLSGIENPDDRMAAFLAEAMGVEIPENYHSLVDLCESLLRSLRTADPVVFDAETLYVQSFMDIVQDFAVSQGNSLRAFLKKWSEDKSNISSPKSDDAVRIMTVHKSKGLDFPYVIFPSLGSVGFFAHGARWAKPDVEGTELEDVADGVYDVHLSSKSVDTLFEERYKEEMLMQYVDNINILYVAFTRAAKAMTVVSPMPEADDFSRWTLDFMREHGERIGFVAQGSEEEGSISFRKGEFPELSVPEHSAVEKLSSVFCSYEGERGRLRLSEDARDFFSDEGTAGMGASKRIRGVVLHDVLAKIVRPSDLDDALKSVMLEGNMNVTEMEEVRTLLKEAMESVKDYGWFPECPDQVLNESELMDTDGRIYRPDRVVITGGKVSVIDFKFGEHRVEYERQVRRYAELWHRMGYAEVSAYLWYVQSGEVMVIL